MNDQQFNNNFFTGENSPVPLIPADHAWENMQEKLNTQLPQKKKRRMLLWLPPVGCALLLLLLGGGYGLWQYATREAMPETHERPANKPLPAVAEKSQAPVQEQTANDATGGARIDDELFNDRGTTALPQALKKGTVPPSSATTNIFKKERYHKKELTGSITLQPDMPLLPPNSLRPSFVAGPHYETSILVRPTRAPTPLWLPDGSLTNNSSGNKPASKYVFEMGLQVEVPVPINRADVYFRNPAGENRFYQPFSPGIWSSVRRNRHRITGEFKPFASALLPNETFQKNALIMPDGSVLLGDKKLVKVFGPQAGLQYTYQVNKRWWAGAGMDISMWRKALILSGRDSSSTTSRLRGIHKNDAPYLNSFQPGGVLHLAYESKAWTGMLQIGAPFKPTVQNLSVPVWARLGVRLRLLQSKNASTGGPMDQVRCPR